eukprot:Hpha_TRINITY_DN14946_c0_g1::TRINITY_DN14946_c0_g1_i1::g.145077::m.145077
MAAVIVAAVVGCSVTDVYAGGAHTCARLENKTLRCWGNNTRGVLGQGDTIARGATPATMGIHLPPVPVEASSGSTEVLFYTTGGQNELSAWGCAVLRHNNETKCWGNNGLGQLGLGDKVDRGNQPGDIGAALPPVPFPAGCTVVQIGATAYSTCAVCSDGVSLYCWGGNALGILGVGDQTARGDVSGWNTNWAKTDTGYPILKVLSGCDALHMCAVSPTGDMTCWGSNTHKQLGYVSARIPWAGGSPGEMGANLVNIKQTVGQDVVDGCLGKQFTCALYAMGGVECWGTDDTG